MSALGAHRDHHKKQGINLIKFENLILKALDEAYDWLTNEDKGEIKTIKDSLEEISIQLHSKKEASTNIQYSLLYNITEVTLQILEQAKLFKQTKNE